jgi:adenylate cyclase
MSFPVPENESVRVAALRALEIMDTPPDPAYDEIGELAAQICNCPVGYISFIDEQRVWLKSKYGLAPDFVGSPREIGSVRRQSAGPNWSMFLTYARTRASARILS